MEILQCNTVFWWFSLGSTFSLNFNNPNGNTWKRNKSGKNIVARRNVYDLALTETILLQLSTFPSETYIGKMKGWFKMINFKRVFTSTTIDYFCFLRNFLSHLPGKWIMALIMNPIITRTFRFIRKVLNITYVLGRQKFANWIWRSAAYSEPFQTFKMKVFAKIVIGFQFR